MISAPDIYWAAKFGTDKLIQSLAKDLKDSVIISSSRIVYDTKSFLAEIIHDAESNVVKSKSFKVEVPYIMGIAENNPNNEAFLQTLFETKDSFDEIVNNLKRFDKDKILYLWTPSLESRASRPVRAVTLCFGYFGRFDVGGGWVDDGNGLSRGVLVKSAKQTNKKKGDSDE